MATESVTVPSNRNASREPKKLFRISLGGSGNEVMVTQGVVLQNIMATKQQKREAPTEPVAITQ